jgi:uncharacterized membrane protein
MPERSDELEQLRSEVDALKARVAALEGRSVTAPVTQQRTTDGSGFGLKTVNRIGALTLALGIAFFFKYAADNEWIGPVTRVLIGIGVGFVLMGAGHWLEQRNQRVFSQGIQGCGFASVYISIFAAYSYYHLIAFVPAMTLLFLMSGAAVYLSIRTNNPIISLLGFASALLTPGILSLSWNEFDLAYACIAVAVFGLSIWIATSAPAVANYAYVLGHLCAAVVCLNEMSRRIKSDGSVRTLQSIFLAGYGIALLSAGVRRSAVLNRGLGLLFLGLVIAKLYLYDVWQLHYGSRVTAFVVLGILLLTASYIYSRWKSRSTG